MSTPPLLIPLAPTPQSLTIQLAGVQYGLTVKWCWPAQCWVLDIADVNGNKILSGIPLVTGVDLLAQFAYLDFGGQLIAQTTNNVNAVPNFMNLGVLGNLYFLVVND